MKWAYDYINMWLKLAMKSFISLDKEIWKSNVAEWFFQMITLNNLTENLRNNSHIHVFAK